MTQEKGADEATQVSLFSVNLTYSTVMIGKRDRKKGPMEIASPIEKTPSMENPFFLLL